MTGRAVVRTAIILDKNDTDGKLPKPNLQNCVRKHMPISSDPPVGNLDVGALLRDGKRTDGRGRSPRTEGDAQCPSGWDAGGRADAGWDGPGATYVLRLRSQRYNC